MIFRSIDDQNDLQSDGSVQDSQNLSKTIRYGNSAETNIAFFALILTVVQNRDDQRRNDDALAEAPHCVKTVELSA